jgi:hypothetical protein
MLDNNNSSSSSVSNQLISLASREQPKVFPTPVQQQGWFPIN